jgi:hypothetical protein
MKHVPEHEQLRGRDDRHLAALTPDLKKYGLQGCRARTTASNSCCRVAVCLAKKSPPPTDPAGAYERRFMFPPEHNFTIDDLRRRCRAF